MFKKILATIALLGGMAFGQSQIGNPVDNGPTLPTTATARQIYKLTATDGGHAAGLYSCDIAAGCTSKNDWTGPLVAGGSGTGTVTSFGAGTLSPLFTTSVANSTTTPVLSFALSNFAADTFFANLTSGSAGPTATTMPSCAADGSHALTYASHSLACTAISGGGSPGGSNTQVQFNNSGSFGGIGDVTTDGTNMTVTNGGTLTIANGATLTCAAGSTCPAGSGTVTSSGSPSAGNISAFSTSTNIVPATTQNILTAYGTSLDASCTANTTGAAGAQSLAKCPVSKFTLTGNVSSLSFSGTDNTNYDIYLIQDGTGGRTLSGVTGVNGLCTLDNAANAVTRMRGAYDGNNFNVTNCATYGGYSVASYGTAYSGTPPGTSGLPNIGCWFDPTNKIGNCINDAATSFGNVVYKASATSHQFVTNIPSTGVQATAQPAFSDLSGNITSGQMLALPSGDIYVGNVSNVPAAVALSGDSTINNAGSMTNVALQGRSVPSGVTLDGQLLIGNTATGNWSKATLTQGANVTITNGNGTITIAASGSGGAGTPAVGNTTAVTANANTTSNQQLQEVALSAGYFNTASFPAIFHTSGIFSTVVTPTITLTYKLCTVSGCGSGTAITLAVITSAATITGSSNQFAVNFACGTKTTGATGNLICHGLGAIDLTSGSVVSATYTDANTATSSNIDLTAALFFDTFVAFSSGSGSNSMTEQLTIVGALGNGGTVTSIATTSPITGGTITTTGTIACATCVTSAASLPDKTIVYGSGGGQGTAGISLTTGYNNGGAPSSDPQVAASVSGSAPSMMRPCVWGQVMLSNCKMITTHLYAPAADATWYGLASDNSADNTGTCANSSTYYCPPAGRIAIVTGVMFQSLAGTSTLETSEDGSGAAGAACAQTGATLYPMFYHATSTSFAQPIGYILPQYHCMAVLVGTHNSTQLIQISILEADATTALAFAKVPGGSSTGAQTLYAAPLSTHALPLSTDGLFGGNPGKPNLICVGFGATSTTATLNYIPAGGSAEEVGVTGAITSTLTSAQSGGGLYSTGSQQASYTVTYSASNTNAAVNCWMPFLTDTGTH